MKSLSVRLILYATFVFTIQAFLGSFLHEGGHALVPLVHGEKITLIVHPFTFAGFSRPIWDYYNVWTHISGPLGGILVPLLIFALIWKRRSPVLLPLLLPFAFGIIFEGVNMLQPGNGDFFNLARITGLSYAPFLGLGVLLLVAGIFFTLSLFPLLGLAPKDKKCLYIIPASFLLMGLLGTIVARLVVPNSPVLQAEGLVGEVMQTASMVPIILTVLGLLLALLYISLFRMIYPRLPAWLYTPVAVPSGKDLTIHGVLFAFSVALGLMVLLWQ